jgi:DNA-binding NtrC family response regulator
MIVKVPYPENPVLLVDDEPEILTILELTLGSIGINNVIKLTDGRKALDVINSEGVGIVITDLNMPFISGEEIIRQVNENYPTIPVIVITAIDDVKKAIECVNLGASNYITKPIEKTTLLAFMRHLLQNRELEKEISRLKQRIMSSDVENPDFFSDIVTGTGSMIQIFKYIEAIKNTIEPVFITGETGVGKELFASAIHRASGVSGKFIAVNVAGLEDHLFSDTLFGHYRGSFTDAKSLRKGLIEEAEGGTLFLDEIGDLSTPSQVKLLRLLQEKEYYPIGADTPKYSNAKIIVATNISVSDLEQSKSFRKDLFFRLTTHHVNIPPLRERKEDLALLIPHFIFEAEKVFNKKIKDVPRSIYSCFYAYFFPGNVRELRAIVFDLVGNSSDGKLSVEYLREKIFRGGQVPRGNADRELLKPENLFRDILTLPTIKEIEEILVEESMRRGGSNQTVAAKMLGISQQALSQRLKKMVKKG